MRRLMLILALGSSLSALAQAADAPPPPTPAPTYGNLANPFYDPSRFELRGGGFASTWGPEKGSPDINGELVFPKVFSLPGWQDILIPRFHIGGMDNLTGRTSYVYAGALWTYNWNRFFAEYFFGGTVHNGPLRSDFDPDRPNLGCRFLYHIGANAGYRLDQNWSVMVTFDHASDGEPTLSSCHGNTGISVLGLRVGRSF